MSATATADTMPGKHAQIAETKYSGRARLVTIFARLDEAGRRRVHYIHDLGKPDYAERVIDGEQPVPSMALNVPAALWHEREIHDQFGIEFSGSPDLRQLLFHESWPAGAH